MVKVKRKLTSTGMSSLRRQAAALLHEKVGPPINKCKKGLSAMAKKKCLLLGLFIAACGVGMMAGGAVLPSITYGIFNTSVTNMLTLHKEDIDAEWRAAGSTNDTAKSVEYWLPHVTNAAAVLSSGAAPIIEDKGPYVLREYEKKHTVYFATDDVVSWRKELTYAWDEEKSCKPSAEDVVNALQMKALAEKLNAYAEDASEVEYKAMETLKVHGHDIHKLLNSFIAAWKQEPADGKAIGKALGKLIKAFEGNAGSEAAKTEL